MEYVLTNSNGLTFCKKDVTLRILQNQIVKIARKPVEERNEREIMRIAEFFRYFNLFKNISSIKDILFLAQKCTYQYFPAESTIFHIGDPPLYYYVIVKGCVAGGPRKNYNLVGKYFDEIDIIFELGAGRGFGELAILEDDVRTVSIKAVKDSHLILIPKDDYKAIVCPIVAQAIVSNSNLLKNQDAFRTFNDSRLREFCSFLFENNYRSDSCLGKQGESPCKVFIIKSGRVDCFYNIYAEKLSEKIKKKYKGLIEIIDFPIRMNMGTLGKLNRQL